jgi:hypothetical protein
MGYFSACEKERELTSHMRKRTDCDVQEDGRMTEELREAVGTSRAASRHISTTLTLGLGRNYVTPLYLYCTVYSTVQCWKFLNNLWGLRTE